MALQTRSDMELWDRPFQSLLLGVLAVNVLAHYENVAWWVLIASLAALAWKIGHLYFSWPLPPKRALYLVGAGVGAMIIWEYRTFFGHEAATPILVFLASLKMLETNRDRDARFIIVTSYFLLMAHLLHSQSLTSTLFMALDVALITVLMYQLHRSDRRVTFTSLRPVVRILILTLPVWIFLFMVFPRFTIKTFRKATPTQATGFNESLDPGSVSSLAQSDEVAFRVTFSSGPIRNADTMYWRGAVLYEGDGLVWKPRREREVQQSRLEISKPNLLAQSNTSLSKSTYEVMTEPGQGVALFTLPTLLDFETPTSMPFYMTSDGLLRMTAPLADRVVYKATSIAEEDTKVAPLSRELFRRSLVRPTETSAKYRALVHELEAGVSNPRDAIRKIDDWFSKNDFRYTLNQDLARSSTLEDFLFEGKKGFCEHFATASASLLRSMGFPARVVVGYQGGKWNSVSNALIVRSKDAHAWVEVWHPSSQKILTGRWLTYDPTGAIAPLRLRLGGDFLDLPAEQQRQRDLGEDVALTQLMNQNFIIKMTDQMMMMWDFAQMSWTQFLLNYDQSGQRQLLNSILNWLGLTSKPWVISVLVIAFGAILLRLAFLWRSRLSKENRIRTEWLRLEEELRKIGIMKSDMDGPLTLMSRTQQSEILAGIQAFMNLQYAHQSGSQHRETVRKTLRQLHTARQAARKVARATKV